ncbi:MAG: lysophospholipid acyltransferase family protein [Thermoanaerobaculia bacterium]
MSDAAASSGRRRARSAGRHRAELGLFRIAAGALALLPRGAREGLARRLALLAVRLGASRRRILLDNLAIAFPEKDPAEIARIARDSAASLGEAFADFLEVSAMSEERIRSRIRVVGEENLRQARARGKGVFLLSAHFGGWELGAIRAGLLGEPIAPVVRPLDNPLLERELSRRRTRFGNRPIAKREAARDILRALRRGETVAILVDQNVLAREAVFVPFFGRLAATTPALALFQLKTDAPVVPVFTWPEGSGRYRLEFEKPIDAEEFRAGGGRDASVTRATARYMEVTEAAIRKAPAAWLWVHNRWRTRPENESGVGSPESRLGNRGC